ncbi:MAG: hypothetical protein WDN47_00705 [Candidatus Doudnabacteria bacterium]
MSGKAVSFATPDQRQDVRSIERLIKINLPVKQSPDLATGFTQPEQPRHGYVRQTQQRNERFPRSDRPRQFPLRRQKIQKPLQTTRAVSAHKPGAPQDQGFDANHRKPFDSNRISYRNDRDSY